MYLSKLGLKDFRNFSEALYDFSQGLTIIVGANAAGKTNILEAINLLATGKSFKAKVEGEMIRHGTQIARVKGRVKTEKPVDLEIVLTHGSINIGSDNPQKVARKKMTVNGSARRLVDFAGNIKTVLFAPQDMELVTDAPSVRRKFLDNILSQADREYRRSILSYEKGLRQRNRLLYKIREEGVSRSQLIFWDRLLIKNGDYISSRREEFLEYVNQKPALSKEKFSLEYDKSAISEGRLAEYAREEIFAAKTLVGPHRDDFIFYIEKGKGKPRSLASFGSRGEMRMGVLWLKMAEIDYVERAAAARPTLLLDDIFSELDEEHRNIIMDSVNEQQTIITTADPHFVVDFKEANLINL